MSDAIKEPEAVMTKYGSTEEVQIEGLRNDESRLMQAVATLMADPDCDQDEFSRVDSELQRVRAQISKLDGVQPI